jgi:hypothetical protein
VNNRLSCIVMRCSLEGGALAGAAAPFKNVASQTLTHCYSECSGRRLKADSNKLLVYGRKQAGFCRRLVLGPPCIRTFKHGDSGFDSRLGYELFSTFPFSVDFLW